MSETDPKETAPEVPTDAPLAAIPETVSAEGVASLPVTALPRLSANTPEHLELIQAIAAGEQYALARAYDLFSKPLFGLAMRLLRNRQEAEDILHDVFMFLRDHAEDYDAKRGSVFSWLLLVTRSRVIDRIRKTRRRAELVAESAPSDFGWEDDGPSPAPVEAAEGQERALTVRQALLELTQEDRQALELAYFTGLTQQEIAERLQEPLGTIKSRIRRSLLRLREIVGGQL